MDRPGHERASAFARARGLNATLWCGWSQLRPYSAWTAQVRGSQPSSTSWEACLQERRLAGANWCVGSGLGRPVGPGPEGRWPGPSRARSTGKSRPSPLGDGRYNPRPLLRPGPALEALARGLTDGADRPPQARGPRPGEDPRRLPGGPTVGQPTVILAQTKKGCSGWAAAGQGRMTPPAEEVRRTGPGGLPQPLPAPLGDAGGGAGLRAARAPTAPRARLPPGAGRPWAAPPRPQAGPRRCRCRRWPATPSSRSRPTASR